MWSQQYTHIGLKENCDEVVGMLQYSMEGPWMLVQGPVEF